MYILTGQIQTGKTTSLLQWAAERKDVYGILTPVVNGKRMFMNVHSKEQFPMEAGNNEETLAVGRFIFSKNNFSKAIQIIRNAIHKGGWLVIDEIGPLELKGGGFHDVLKEVLAARKNKILLVVREALAEDVQQYFAFNATALIKPDVLFHLQ